MLLANEALRFRQVGGHLRLRLTATFSQRVTAKVAVLLGIGRAEHVGFEAMTVPSSIALPADEITEGIYDAKPVLRVHRCTLVMEPHLSVILNVNNPAVVNAVFPDINEPAQRRNYWRYVELYK